MKGMNILISKVVILSLLILTMATAADLPPSGTIAPLSFNERTMQDIPADWWSQRKIIQFTVVWGALWQKSSVKNIRSE